MNTYFPPLRLKSHLPKKDFFQSLIKNITSLGFNIDEVNSNKPWGGYIRITNNQAKKFRETYFAGIELPEQAINLDISPKILIVEPHKSLSYQVHDRRSEFWRVLIGPTGVKLHDKDNEPEDFIVYQSGETINIPVGTRHRLVGLNNMSIITELWIHLNPHNPSNEQDIRRIQDDFGRNNKK